MQLTFEMTNISKAITLEKLKNIKCFKTKRTWR